MNAKTKILQYFKGRNLFRLFGIFLICSLVMGYIKWQTINYEEEIKAIYKDREIFKGYKTILVYDIPEWFNIRNGIELFNELECPVRTCRITRRELERESTDLVVFFDHYVQTSLPRSPTQIYAMYHIESPLHTQSMPYPDVFNWTITYRNDSTVPAPYRKWTYFDPNVTQLEQNHNYAANKTKKCAWFVSNCYDKNGRLKYAKELQKYIEVDIYGRCGALSCSRTNKNCFDALDKDYKFYLSFENSNCREYITEKFFDNALGNNVLPIVMGAPYEDYERLAPFRSFLHVDQFKSPEELATFLHLLDQRDDLYNAYFQWKGTGKVTYAHRHLFCNLCEMLHNETILSNPSWYADVNEWWANSDICTRGTWRQNH